MQRNPVGWFEIYVQDMERAAASNQAVFQNQSRSSTLRLEIGRFR